jgi:hypothetical protein
MTTDCGEGNITSSDKNGASGWSFQCLFHQYEAMYGAMSDLGSCGYICSFSFSAGRSFETV